MAINARQYMKDLKEVVDGWRTQPEVVINFIKWNNRFDKYSAFNRMMIMAQRPDATRCTSFKDWEALGRGVRGKGTGIVIFHPNIRKTEVVRNGETVEDTKVYGYGHTHTYDISNTIPLDPENDEYEALVAAITRPERSIDELDELVTLIAEAAGITLTEIRWSARSNVLFTRSNREIVVNTSNSSKEHVFNRLIAVIGETGNRLVPGVTYGYRDEASGTLNPKNGLIDLESVLTALAIADRFGVDISVYAHLLAAPPEEAEGDLAFNNVLLAAARSVKMFDQVQSGVPYEWAQVYMMAATERDREEAEAE